MAHIMEVLVFVWPAKSIAKPVLLQQLTAYPAIVWEEWGTILVTTSVLLLAPSTTTLSHPT